MPSPFPGMDPYIEDPEIWGDFHGDLAGEIRAVLNGLIQPRYVARLTPRVTYEVVELGEIVEIRSVRPDIGIWQPQPPTGTVAQTTTIVTKAPAESIAPMEVQTQIYSVEILEVGTMRLVTAIEILSPINKRPGHEARDEYLRKRRAILRSHVHLIEIDLLRDGERSPLLKPVPPAPYYVLLSRGNRRPFVEVWPIRLQDRLPVIPVPLLSPDPDVPLDLGAIVATVYDRGAYGRLIDYRQSPPPPPLPDEEASWLDSWLREKKLR